MLSSRSRWTTVVRSGAAGLLLVSGMLAGCGEGVGPAGDIPSAEYPLWTATERMVLGGAVSVGAAALGSVVAVALYGDSLLAIADGHTEEVHLFNLEGELLRSLAGAGDGPGLARAIRLVSFDPDGGICLWDQQLARLTHFDSAGTVSRTWTPSHDSFSRLTSQVVAVTHDCSGAVFRESMSPEVEVGQTDRGFVQMVRTITHVVSQEREAVRELTRRSAPPVWVFRTDGLNSVHEVVLGERLESAMVGSVLWFGISDSFRWDRVDINGTRLSPVILPTVGMPPTADDVQHERARRKGEGIPAVLRSSLSAADVEQILAATDQGRDEVPASPTFPAYDAMIAGPHSTLWVRESSSHSVAVEPWLLLDSNGVPLGRLLLPKGGEAVAASARVLVMLHQDAFDAPYLRIWDVRPDGEGGGR